MSGSLIEQFWFQFSKVLIEMINTRYNLEKNVESKKNNMNSKISISKEIMEYILEMLHIYFFA